MINVLKVLFIFLIFISSAFSEVDCNTELDPFASLLQNTFIEKMPNCINPENSGCEECLTIDSQIKKSDIEVNKIIKTNFLNQLMDHHKKIMFDFLTYKEDLSNKALYLENIRTCEIKENIYTTCSSDLKSIISKSSQESIEIFNQITSIKNKDSIKQGLKSLRKIKTRGQCLNIIDSNDILKSEFSSMLFTYYLNEQRSSINKNGDFQNGNAPISNYYMDSTTQININKISQSDDQNKYKKVVQILEKSELTRNIESKCSTIKESINNICNGKTYKDTEPLMNTYSKNDDEKSLINQKICYMNRNNLEIKNAIDVQDIMKKLKHPVDLNASGEVSTNIGNGFKKKYENILKNQASKICNDLESSKESRKEVLSKLKEIIEKEPDTILNKAVVDIFIPANVVKLVAKNEESEDRPSTSKSVEQPTKNEAVNTSASSNFNNLSSNNEASKIKSVNALTAPSPLSKNAQITTATIATANIGVDSQKSTIQSNNNRNVSQTESTPVVKNDNNQKRIADNSNTDIRNNNNDNNNPLVSNAISDNRAIYIDIQPKEALKDISSPKSFEKLTNAEFADKNRPYTDATSQAITLNEAYFPKEGLNDRNTINPKYLDAYFATFDDDLYYLIQSMNSKVIAIKNPYFPDEKIKIDLSISEEENVKITKQNQNLTKLQQENIIHIKKKIYKIGLSAMIAKKNTNEAILRYKENKNLNMNQSQIDNLTKGLYEKLMKKLNE